jgi:proline dehydrogenase
MRQAYKQTKEKLRQTASISSRFNSLIAATLAVGKGGYKSVSSGNLPDRRDLDWNRRNYAQKLLKLGQAAT